MIVSVESSLISSYGGLKQLTIESKDGTSSSGSPSNDWFVVETQHDVPTSIGKTGIAQSEINLFVEIKYRYEQDGSGFNWGDSSNLQSNPVLKVRVAKSSSVVSDSNGCPTMTPHVFDTGSNTWTSSGVSISNPVSIDANTCELDMTVPHFSRFSLSSTPSSTSNSGGSSSNSGSSSSSGGAGGGGSAVGGVSTSSGAGFGGKLGNPVVLYEISYDACEKNMVRIIAGMYGNQAPAPYVKIRTPDHGVYTAELAKDQPYADANKKLSVSRYVYEAPLNSDLKYFVVTAEQINGRIATSVSYLVNVYSCSDTIIVNPMTDLDQGETYEPTLGAGRPNIFDIKFQVNSNKQVQSSEINQFVKNTDQVKVSSIIETPVSLSRSELRVAVAGGNYSEYAAVKMNVALLQNITNVYTASAELPTSFLQAPAIVYWIHAVTTDNKVQDSEKYYLGVKPTYKIDARMELDSVQSKAEGATYRPTAYIYNNGEKSLFGTVSLLVNGEKVYTSSEQVFKKGQSVIDLTWKLPKLEQESKYDVNARLNLYDEHVDTIKTTLQTFVQTKIAPIYEPIMISSIIGENGQTTARAGVIYSSNPNQDLHYRVVAPDGTCVVGQSESCLVKDPTLGNRGNTLSVTLGDQVYRVKYTGTNDPLERFSITSIDPIVGKWSITLEPDTGVVSGAYATENVVVKMKYRAMDTNVITVRSE
jgi:hypothetical protein